MNTMNRQEDTLPLDAFGLCPECVAMQDYSAHLSWLTVARVDYVACEKHQVYWWFQTSSYLNPGPESAAEWQANADKLNKMRQVEPRYLTVTEAADAAKAKEVRIAASYLDMLSDKHRKLILVLVRDLSGGHVGIDDLRDDLPEDSIPDDMSAFVRQTVRPDSTGSEYARNGHSDGGSHAQRLDEPHAS